MRVVGGVLQGIDWDRHWAIIGGHLFELLVSHPAISGLSLGTEVVASVAVRDGRRQVVDLRPSTAARVLTSAG